MVRGNLQTQPWKQAGHGIAPVVIANAEQWPQGAAYPQVSTVKGPFWAASKKAIRILYRSQIDETSPFVHAKL